MKKKALVVCPGRGTYGKEELGYLRRFHADKAAFIKKLDEARQAQGQISVSDLDGVDRFSLSEFSRGDNASPLIYACAYSDFLSIDKDNFEVVAVTGNSMGWYIALACGGAVSPEGGMEIINTMGTLMHENQIGGQVVYPFVDERWQVIPKVRETLFRLIDEIDDLYLSIELGGMVVFAGSDAALDVLMEKLEPRDCFPLRLAGHGAFHTPLMQSIAAKGRSVLKAGLFHKPRVSLIDGRGSIWRPYSTDVDEIYSYTLDHQVCRTYDFTKAMHVGLKEFAPDAVIVLGPGNTLGGAVAQCLVRIKWQEMASKEDFTTRQKGDAYMFSMGLR